MGQIMVCIEGPNKGETYPLSQKQMIFGRATECDVCIPTPLVSRRHALLVYDNGTYVLYDHNSTNGTWINGERISKQTLQARDQIQIGPSVFILELTEQGQTAVFINNISVALPEPIILLDAPQFARYHILENWVGGMATVYKAQDKKTGDVVAIKILDSHNDYIQSKFLKEIQMSRSLKHPHIVQGYGGGKVGNTWYMIMEFVDGGTLLDRMLPGQPLPLNFAVQIIGQMCEALWYAHERGIYHRDLKPSNILLTTTGLAKLGDFGIARLVRAVTRTNHGFLLGTPRYMSYEQIKGQEIDHRSDLYSLGLILYELITGLPPFNAPDVISLLEQHVNQEPVAPSYLNPEISQDLEQATLRVLQKDRTQRFQTALEMARALHYNPTQSHTLTNPTLPDYKGLILVAGKKTPIKLEDNIIHLTRQLINPDDKQISRHHAQVVHRADCWWLQDNGSANGTFLNEDRIFEPVMLHPGDQIRVGRTTLQVKTSSK